MQRDFKIDMSRINISEAVKNFTESQYNVFIESCEDLEYISNGDKEYEAEMKEELINFILERVR